ncbi:MAG TPA: hypothetical protein VKE74_35670 [Gemmataceae bacterium]|nr:hypothetical protein [Gemmataceae bacterium]
MLPLLLCLAPAEPTAADLAPHAAGVALVEVVSVIEKDARPSDGPLYDEIQLRVVRGSGEVPEIIVIVKAPGGHPPPPGSAKPPPPKFSVRPGALKKGQRYWVAFSSPYEHQAYPEGVIAFWPQDDRRAAKVLDEAVKADRWRWHPRYDPTTGLTCGRLIEPDKKLWQVRVWKDDEVLWEMTVPGTPSKRYYSWGFWDAGPGGFPTHVPKSGRLLVAETALTLDAGNEFDLPAGPYYLCSTFDPHTGNRLSACVTVLQDPHVIHVQRDYDPRTGRYFREERFDWPKSGDKAVGAGREDWYRKVARTFDPKTGKLTAEEVFRWDETKSGDERWVKVSPK